MFFTAAAVLLSGLLLSCEQQKAAVQLDTPDVSVAERTETTFTIQWPAVLNADSYVYVLNDGEEQSTTDCSVMFSGLEPGAYVAGVKAVSGDVSYADSEWGQVEVTIKEVSRPESEIGQNWAGQYDVTSTQRVTMSVEELADGSYALYTELKDEPMEFTVEIEADPSGKETGYLYGWSFNADKIYGTQFYAPVVLMDGDLVVTSDVVATDENGYSYLWMPCTASSDGVFSILSGLDYAFRFRKDGDVVKNVPEIDAGSTSYSINAMELTIGGTSPVYSTADFPVDIPAGEFTLVRK